MSGRLGLPNLSRPGGGRPAFTRRRDLPCQQEDPDVFFTVDTASIAYAKTVCQPCPVRRECLDYALDTDQRGVWGATSDADRRAIADGIGRCEAGRVA